jgi:hypothetical protein
MRHYEHLLQWDLLPRLSTADGVSSIAPLTPTEFISHVIVPEASIRLIMQDKGWTGRYSPSTKKYTRAREAAFRIRRASVAFGRGRYMADGDDARDLLDRLQERDAEFRAECREVRRKERAKLAEVSITIVSSDESEVRVSTPKKKPRTIRQHQHDPYEDSETENDLIVVADPTPRQTNYAGTGNASLPVQIDSASSRSSSITTGKHRPLRKTHSVEGSESGQTESSYGMDEMDGEFEEELYALGEKLEGGRGAKGIGR